MLTPVLAADDSCHQKYCSDHGLECPVPFQELLAVPHVPLGAWRVMTEYLNSFDNSDDTQVLLSAFCFESIFTYPGKTWV